MKKIISLLLILALVFTVCAFASADDMEISYTTDRAFVLVIPANTSFSSSKLTFSGSVLLNNVRLEKDTQIDVTMSSANDFNLKFEDSAIPYAVADGDGAIDNNSVVLSVAAGSTSGAAELTFSTTEEDIAQATLAGAHIDTLSFEVEVVPVETYEG